MGRVGKAEHCAKRRWLRQRMLVLLCALVAASCSSAPAPQTFDLSAVHSGLAAGRTRGQVEITEPSASAAIDTDRIVVRTSPEAIAYLSGSQWSARLPALVQTRLLQTFENAQFMQSVDRSGARFTADYALTSEIRSFEIDVQQNQALVEVAARIVAESSGRIIAAQIFTARVPTSVKDGAAPAVALDQALAEVMRAIVRWTGAKI
jgi:cholesterol transport system auxiliary component